jgi:diadenosine tetraphosphate (Ap4A) HIT family hydrolase
MLDAPVTGGVWGAEQAKLAFFVGGGEQAFERQRDVFAALGTPTHIGPNGNGQIAKMVCQMLGSVTYAVNAEALALCDNLGVDAARVAASFSGGQRLGRMVELRQSGQIGSEGYTAQRGKDIDCAVEAAAQSQTFIPVTSAVHQVFNLARLAGLGAADPDALFWCGTNCATPVKINNRGKILNMEGSTTQEQRCICCDTINGFYEPPGGVLYQNSHRAVYLRARPLLVDGQGFIALRRHCEGIGELTPDEALSLGPFLQDVTRVFHRVLAPERVHLGFYGEETRHLHWHLTPRTQNLPAGNVPLTFLHALRGALRQFGLYRPVDDAAVAHLATELRREFSHLASEHHEHGARSS